MADESTAKAYEEARKQRLLDNQKRFEDLGILKLSKSLSDLKRSEKKSQQRQVKHKLTGEYILEPRRSSRARNPVSYREEIDLNLRSHSVRRRSKFSSSWASYIARPLDEVKIASYEERAHAVNYAEKLQDNLQSENPSFVKSMVRSHVYSCFWLGLPTRFCEDHLPKSTVDMVLENENGSEYDAVYISKRTGLSGGWRAFALDHKLDDGDALVFELIEPTRFKVYIVRASECSSKQYDVPAVDGDSDADKASSGASKPTKKCSTGSNTSTRSDNNATSQASAKKRKTR